MSRTPRLTRAAGAEASLARSSPDEVTFATANARVRESPPSLGRATSTGLFSGRWRAKTIRAAAAIPETETDHATARRTIIRFRSAACECAAITRSYRLAGTGRAPGDGDGLTKQAEPDGRPAHSAQALTWDSHSGDIGAAGSLAGSSSESFQIRRNSSQFMSGSPRSS